MHTQAMPIYLASKFDLFINLKTAKAIGITIPASLLVRADDRIAPVSAAVAECPLLMVVSTGRRNTLS